MDEPITREEKYLARMAGEFDDELPDPITRIDRYLKKIAENGGGGGEGGTDNYNLLKNLPKVNGVTLKFDVSLDTLGIASKEALAKKVEQVEGKGLSTNDLTDELKEQYDKALNQDMSNISTTGAAKVKEIIAEEEYAKKSEIPEGSVVDEELSETSKNPVQNKIITAELGKKVNAEENKSLVLDTDIEQITSNKTAIETLNGDDTTVGSVAKQIKDAIGDITQFDIKIVDALPATGTKGIIYLVPKTESTDPDYHDEYVWTGDKFELIGNTKVDLSDYVKKDGNKVLSTNDYTDEEKADVATIGDKVDSTQIVTEFGDEPSDTNVPSEKLVYDSIEHFDERIDQLQLFKFPNAVIHGEPTINNGQVSNFTASNYLAFPFLVDFKDRPFEINMAFTTGTDVSNQHNIIDGVFGLAFAVSNSKFVLALSSDGQTWDIGNFTGTHTVAASTNYYVKLTWDGATYKLSYSFDKETWTDDITVSSSASLYPIQMYIGVGEVGTASPKPFNGIINMNDSNVYINGNLVWQGMDDVGLSTRLATDLDNVDELGIRKIQQIAETDKKVDKVDGKGLSTVDFTDANYIHTDNNYDDDAVAEVAKVKDKVDKVDGKSLVSDSEIERLKDVENYDDTEIKEQIGDLTTLKTSDKTNVVKAINEVNYMAKSLGNTDGRMANDLNDCEDGLLYAYRAETLNIPVPYTYGVARIVRGADDLWIFQIAIRTTGNVYIRRSINDGVWQPWQELVTKNYLSDVLMSENTSVTDLNEHTGQEGKQHYYVYANSLCANIPIHNGDDFQVEIISKYENSCIQIAYTLDNSGRETVGNIYTRSAQMSHETLEWTWTDWKKLNTGKEIQNTVMNVTEGGDYNITDIVGVPVSDVISMVGFGNTSVYDFCIIDAKTTQFAIRILKGSGDVRINYRLA